MYLPYTLEIISLYGSHSSQYIDYISFQAEWLLDAGYTMNEIHEVSRAALNNPCRKLVTKTQLREKANEFQENLKKTVDWMVCNKDVDNISDHGVSDDRPQVTPKPRKSLAQKQLTRRPSTAFL